MPIYELDGLSPTLPENGDYWIAPDAVLIGKVVLEPGASIWFGSVLRGDNEEIRVGAGSNVQDNSILHTDIGYPLTIGANCTIGHGVTLHGCTIHEQSLIGMGATVLNGAVIGARSLVGAGALVAEGKVFAEGHLIVGIPAVVRRPLSADAVAGLMRSAENYRAYARRFHHGLRQIG